MIATGLVLSYSPASPAALAGTAAAAALLGALATPFVRSRLALELCGVAYALAFALVTPALRDLPQIGLALILWSFAVVWLTDGRPLFFSQPRVGRHRWPFRIWKLRTMTTESDVLARRPTRLGGCRG